MAITDTQKIDLLLKKVGYGVAKTDTAANKSASNEGIASPLLLRGDLIWVKSGQIPSEPPAATDTLVSVYKAATSKSTTNDANATANRTWLTNSGDWIPPEFGSKYQVKIWTAPAGTVNPTLTGTRLFADGSGNNDSWYFDYQAGVLNFPDTNLPASVAGNSVFVEGYRYIGAKGFAQALDEGFISRGSDPADWDQNTTFGLFYVNRVSWSGTVGTPSEAFSAGLLTILTSVDICVQKYQPNDTISLVGSEYVRIKTVTGPWTAWSRVVSETGRVDGGTF